MDFTLFVTLLRYYNEDNLNISSLLQLIFDLSSLKYKDT